MQVAQRDRELFMTAEVNEFIGVALGGLKSRVDCIPAQFCRRDDIDGRRRLEDLIAAAFDGALTDIEKWSNEEHDRGRLYTTKRSGWPPCRWSPTTSIGPAVDA